MIISAMPLFPGGVGIGELGFGKLYTWFGSAASNGVLGSLVQRVIYWVIGFAGYLVYLRMRAPGLKAEKLIAEEANDEQEPPVQDLDAECQVA